MRKAALLAMCIILAIVVIVAVRHWGGDGDGEVDTTPPVISGISVSSIDDTNTTINWTTNEPATSQVEYGRTTSYDSISALNTTLVTSHSIMLSGLDHSTTYHYRVKSKDASDNERLSGDYTFTTDSPPASTFTTAAMPDWFHVGEPTLIRS